MGFENSDDAGVYRISDHQALVTTADFITPPVDGPYIYGQIAAANSLSDIYAMGGKPVTCLNLVCFPTGKLDESILHQIIEGAISKISEAGAVLAGGHSTEDPEPKFGLSVTGLVHPEKYWANKGAQPGDLILLTKPIGSGLLFNANLKGAVSSKAMESCISELIQLNRIASEILTNYEINAATDITGFGLAGHSFEMARASKVTFAIDYSKVPVFDEAEAMSRLGFTTGVSASNLEMIEETCDLSKLEATSRELMVDPQTSGGLLVSVPRDQANSIIKELAEAGLEAAAIIGEVMAYDDQYYLRFS